MQLGRWIPTLGGTCCIYVIYSEDEGSSFLRNVCAFYQVTRCINTEDLNIYSCCHQKLIPRGLRVFQEKVIDYANQREREREREDVIGDRRRVYVLL